MLCLYTVFIFLIHNYNTIKNYKDKLQKQLNIFIFLNKDYVDIKYITQLLNNTGLIFKKYISSKTAYLHTVNNNKFLKNIVIPDIYEALPSYIICQPKYLPNNAFIYNINNKLNKNHYIDEIIFDNHLFAHYVTINNEVSLYNKLFYIYIFFSLLLIMLKLYIINQYKVSKKKLFIKINIFLALLSLVCSIFLCKFLYFLETMFIHDVLILGLLSVLFTI
jgi:hypothetical protein